LRAEPEAVGICSDRLGRIIPALTDVEAGRLLGAVIAIAPRGHLVFHEAGRLPWPGPHHADAARCAVPIASMIKPVTGVAGLLLWEEGRSASPIRSSASCRNLAAGALRC
jgi:CubicO group peptidase (beta-lactamase class C family)